MAKTFTKLIFPELSYGLTGVLFNVHNKLGRFCNEKQYSDAIEHYLKCGKIIYEKEKVVPKDQSFEKERRNIIDFLIDDKIILEIKAKRILTKGDYYQLKRYLICFNKKLGIIVNFRQKYIRPYRV